MPLDGAAEVFPPAERVEALIREAESHFQAGRRHYQQGEVEAARTEFDRAVDVLLAVPERAPDRARAERQLEELVEAIHRMDLAGLGAGDAASEPVFQKAPLEEIPQLTFRVDPALKHKVLEEVRATASQLPLVVNDAVLSYIQYFSSERGRKIVSNGLRRAGRYRPLIRRILDEEGLPPELIHLAQAESGFQPRAVSRKRATGMWQFVRTRGHEYGLTQSPYADDRLDPEKATRAAARHLRDLYDRFGNWFLAMAAYNAGPGLVERAVERTGYADFWELRRRNVLPKETANYVPIVLAMTIVSKNAREYGLEDIGADPAVEYDTLEMAAATHLPLISDLAERTVSEVRELNPALLKSVAPPGHALRLPKGTGASVSAALEKVPLEKRGSWRVHRLGEGETLGVVAQRYHTTQSSIRTANRFLDGSPEPGDFVLIPAAAPQARGATQRSVKRPASRTAAGQALVAHRSSR